MKEIIYLDTEIMNSLLAQLDEGLIQSFSLESSGEETNGQLVQTTKGKDAGFTAGLKADSGLLPGGGLNFQAHKVNNGTESVNSSKTILEGQKDILNKAFHDYSIELLIDKLTQRGLLNDNTNLNEGDLFLGESTYRFYDFHLISKASSSTFMQKILLADFAAVGLTIEEAQKLSRKSSAKLSERERDLKPIAEMMVKVNDESKPIINVMEVLGELSEFSSKLLDDLVVIKTTDKVGLLKKEMLRESSEALSFRTDKTRKVKFLVRVIGNKDILYDGITSMPNFKEEDLDMIPSLMLDIILNSFKILMQGDLLVSPIAIFYE